MKTAEELKRKKKDLCKLGGKKVKGEKFDVENLMNAFTTL
jgi:hypothetical protein